MSNLALAIVAATLALGDWHTPTELPAGYEVGFATYADVGVFENTMRVRGIDPIPGSVPVALNAKGDLGRGDVWLRWPSGRIDKAQVVDCAQEAHYQDRVAEWFIVEVPAEVAMREGFYRWGPWPVEVWYGYPKDMPVMQ